MNVPSAAYVRLQGWRNTETFLKTPEPRSALTFSMTFQTTQTHQHAGLQQCRLIYIVLLFLLFDAFMHVKVYMNDFASVNIQVMSICIVWEVEMYGKLEMYG